MTYFPNLSPKALDFFIMLESLPTWSPHSSRPRSLPLSFSQQLLQNLCRALTCPSNAGFRSKQQEGVSHIVSKLVESPSFNDQPFVTLKQ